MIDIFNNMSYNDPEVFYNIHMDPILLRITDVSKLTSLSRSSIYRMISNGDFPKQIAIGDRQARWSRTEIEEWCQQQIYANQSA